MEKPERTFWQTLYNVIKPKEWPSKKLKIVVVCLFKVAIIDLFNKHFLKSLFVEIYLVDMCGWWKHPLRQVKYSNSFNAGKGLNLLYINGLLQRGIATSGVKEWRFPGPQIVLKMFRGPWQHVTEVRSISSSSKRLAPFLEGFPLRLYHILWRLWLLICPFPSIPHSRVFALRVAEPQAHFPRIPFPQWEYLQTVTV